MATTKDYELALSWYQAFVIELDLQMHGIAENVSNAIYIDALYFWEVDAEIVSLAGHAAIVETPSGITDAGHVTYRCRKSNLKGIYLRSGHELMAENIEIEFQ